MTSQNACQMCPLNCGSCKDLTGECTQCQPGFSLYQDNQGGTQCISDSTVGVCQVQFCKTCQAADNTTCAICAPGYELSGSECGCQISLTLNGQYFTQDWSMIVVMWNGQVSPSKFTTPSNPT